MADVKKKQVVVDEGLFKTFKPCLVCTMFDGVGKEASEVEVGRGAGKMKLTLSRTECKKQCWLFLSVEPANPQDPASRMIADATTYLEVRLPHKVVPQGKPGK